MSDYEDYEDEYEDDYDEDGPPKRKKVGRFNPNRHFAEQLGGYVALPKVFLPLLKPEDAIALFYLRDQHERFKKTNDGWFYLTRNTMERALNFNKDRQARILRRLEKPGFIKRKFDKPAKGKGFSVRVVRIDFQRIAKVAAEAQQDSKDMQEQSQAFYEKMRTTRIGVRDKNDCKFKPKLLQLRGLRNRVRKRTA